MADQKILGAILFEDFELLDLYGPLEMFGNIGPELKIITINYFSLQNMLIITQQEKTLTKKYRTENIKYY